MNNNADKFHKLIGKVFKDENTGVLWIVVNNANCPDPQRSHAKDYGLEVFLYTGRSNHGGSAGFNPIKHLAELRPLLTKDELRMETMLNPLNELNSWGVELNYD